MVKVTLIHVTTKKVTPGVDFFLATVRAEIGAFALNVEH